MVKAKMNGSLRLWTCLNSTQPPNQPTNVKLRLRKLEKWNFVYFFISLSMQRKRRSVRFSSLSLFDDHQHCVNFLVKHGTFIMYPAHKWSFKKICNLVFKLQNKQNTKKFECERLGWNVCAAARDERRSRCLPSPCLASQFSPQPRGIIQLIAPFCLLCLVFQLDIKRFFKISDNRNLILFASSSPSSRFAPYTNTNRWAHWGFLQGLQATSTSCNDALAYVPINNSWCTVSLSGRRNLI